MILFHKWKTVSGLFVDLTVLNLYHLVLGNECDHYKPSDEVRHSTYAEDYEVTRRFAFKTEELHVGARGIVEQTA